jgi:membrane protein implicated in regulation of membrane protease activity
LVKTNKEVKMWVLIVGVIFIILELLTGSFYIIWYGIGLTLSGAVGWSISDEHYLMQAVIGLVIGAILMFGFRERVLNKISINNKKDEFLLEKGKGVVAENSLVEFRGTTWRYENKTGDIFEIGEEVSVIPTNTNKVFIEKIK